MSRLPTQALLGAGFLRSSCRESTHLECGACGTLRYPSDQGCSGCGDTSPGRLKCDRCREALPGASGEGERPCFSAQAYETDPSHRLPAFAPDELLWAVREDAQAPVEILTESALRRELSEGRIRESWQARSHGSDEYWAIRELSFPESRAFEEECERQRKAADQEERRQALRREARERRGREKAERDARESAEREEAERVALEAAAKEAAEREAREAEALRARARVAGRLKFCRWAAYLSAAVGAILLWQKAALSAEAPSPQGLIAYVLGVAIAAGLGAAPLHGRREAHLTLSWWSPVAWAIMPFAWPATVGLVACVAYGSVAGEGNTAVVLVSVLIPTLFWLWLARYGMVRAGVALSMDAPWAGLWQPASFKGIRSVRVWLVIAVTILMNALIVVAPWENREVASRLPKMAAVAPKADEAPEQGRKPSSEENKTTPAPKADVKPPSVPDEKSRSTALSSLVEIAQAVNSIPTLATDMAADSLPAVRSAEAKIQQLPKPGRGDRPLARSLLEQALPLLEQGRASEAADILLKAHEADPLDVQIVNDLAFAELRAGRYLLAQEHVIRALELAPTRANAWANFAEILATSRPRDPEAANAASRLYVVAWWYSRDRQRTASFFQQKASASDTPSAVADALTIALARVAPQAPSPTKAPEAAGMGMPRMEPKALVTEPPTSPSASPQAPAAPLTAPRPLVAEPTVTTDVLPSDGRRRSAEMMIARAEAYLRSGDLNAARNSLEAAVRAEGETDRVRRLYQQLRDAETRLLRQDTQIR